MLLFDPFGGRGISDTIRDHPQTHLHGNMVNGKPVVVSVEGRPVSEPDLCGRFTTKEGKENGDAVIPEDATVAS